MMKKSFLAYASCILAALLFVYCSKDDPKDPETPETNPPTISGFTPPEGPVGTEVTINGSNFSATNNENKVKFNSTNATVTTSSSSQLKATVPSGATTGKISVEVGGKTATSSGTFTVTNSTASELSITGFEPTSGIIGTTVTITGTNFSTNPEENVVKFNNVSAEVTAATQNQLTVIVPESASTGTITVTVGQQTAESANVFTVLPWRELESFPGILESDSSRQFGTMVTLTDFEGNTKIFAGLGANGGDPNNKKGDIWSYDINTNSWKQESNFPGGPRNRVFSFVLDNKWYVGGGRNDVPETLNDFWVYDPISNQWNELEAIELGHSLTTFTINDKAYIFGVADDQNSSKYIGLYEYDPTIGEFGTWTRKADLESNDVDGFLYASGFTINNKGYIVSGGTASSYSQEVWEYVPNDDSWTQKAKFEGGQRKYGIGFSINGKGYAGLGSDETNSYHNDLWQFDSSDGPSGSWSEKSSLPSGNRLYSSATAVDGKAYFLFGAIIGGDFEQFWVYDPSLDD